MILQSVLLATETRNALVAAGIAILLAPLAIVAFRTGGAPRLWLGWAIGTTLLLVLYNVLPYLTGYGLSLPLFELRWTIPLVVAIAAAAHIMGRRKAPLWLQMPLVTLLFFVILYPKLGTIIADFTPSETARREAIDR